MIATEGMAVRRLLVASYPFKGTLRGAEAAAAMAAGAARHDPRIASRLLPLGDGGAGTLDALLYGGGGSFHTARCTGATGSSLECRWGTTADGTAVIEAAGAIALADVPERLRDPSRLRTTGLGELLLLALRSGATRIAVGLGDTATHDCGLGVGAILGYRFLDRAGRELPPLGRSLPDLAAIDASGELRLHSNPPITILCDVLNPLSGPDGAALRFAPQKGADPATAALLEQGSVRFAEVARRDLGADVAWLPGAGAAGGLGAGLAAFAGAILTGGAAAVLDAVRFDALAAESDLVITGEGMLDEKTLLGKGVAQVTERARRLNVPVMVVAGRVAGEIAGWERRLGAAVASLEEEPPELSHAGRLAAAVSRRLGRLLAGE